MPKKKTTKEKTPAQTAPEAPQATQIEKVVLYHFGCYSCARDTKYKVFLEKMAKIRPLPKLETKRIETDRATRQEWEGYKQNKDDKDIVVLKLSTGNEVVNMLSDYVEEVKNERAEEAETGDTEKIAE